MSGREYAHFVLSQYPHSTPEHFQNLSKIFDLDARADDLIETYSYGMKKKLQFIIGICTQTQHVLIDEGFAGLDFETSLLTQKIYLTYKNHVLSFSSRMKLISLLLFPIISIHFHMEH